MKSDNVAVLIPCFNEEKAIAQVIRAFRREVPDASIYVYDNNSTDNTAKVAKEAGAIVRSELRQGKGFVVQRMFADIEADVYVMVDGDATYDAASVKTLISTLKERQLDMVVGTRKETEDGAYRPGHKLGNILFNKVLKLLFNSTFQDIFSGYRVFSRRFVKSFPAMTKGFDIETEISVHSLDLGVPFCEVETPFSDRPIGSASKLNTVRDGIKILWRMVILFKEIRPFLFFTLIAGFFAAVSLVLGYPVVTEYLQTGLVPRLPTAVLSTGIMLLGCISFAAGVILDSVGRGRREIKRLHYLKYAC